MTPHPICNHRFEGETFDAFKQRQRDAHRFTKRYLRYGIPAETPRCKRWRDDGTAWSFYVQGGHRTHVAKEYFHSGTLIKYHDGIKISAPEAVL